MGVRRAAIDDRNRFQFAPPVRIAAPGSKINHCRVLVNRQPLDEIPTPVDTGMPPAQIERIVEWIGLTATEGS